MIKLVEDDPHSINDFINTHINEISDDELNILYQCASYWDYYDCWKDFKKIKEYTVYIYIQYLNKCSKIMNKYNYSNFINRPGVNSNKLNDLINLLLKYKK